MARRWKRVSSIPFPVVTLNLEPGSKPIDRRIYVSRTEAAIDWPATGTAVVREVELLLRRLIERAEHRLIIEGQYYWSPSLNEILIRKLHERKGRPFEVIVILAKLQVLKSLSKQMAHHELSLLAKLQAAARGNGTSLRIGTPVALDPLGIGPPRPIYVHSKLLVVDDRFYCIGSANLSDRAFRLDTEINFTIEAISRAEKERIREAGNAVLRHWGVAIPGECPPAPWTRLQWIEADSELQALTRRHPWLSQFPWKSLMDPPAPWAFPLRARIRRSLRASPWSLRLLWGGVWLLEVSLQALLLGFWPGEGLWPSDDRFLPTLSLSLLILSAWILPVPIVLVGLMLVLLLGAEIGARIFVAAYWIVSFISYAMARAFPSRFMDQVRPRAKREAEKLLGTQSFTNYVRWWTIARSSLREKLILQGIHSVSWPWFVLVGQGVVPGAAWLLIRILGLWCK